MDVSCPFEVECVVRPQSDPLQLNIFHPVVQGEPIEHLRDSTDFLAKELDKKGIAVKKVGPYRVRGVELTRFLSETPSTPWLALHVVRKDGKTVISFVPRPPS